MVRNFPKEEDSVNFKQADIRFPSNRVNSGYPLIDLHTGYGQKGKLHLFGDRSLCIDQQHMNEVFKGLAVDYGQTEDFYEVTGGFTVYMAQLFHKKSKFAGICFEFGTIDSHKTLGSLDSLYRVINENQKMKSPKDQALFTEMFYPQSPEWRKAVIEQFQNAIEVAVKNWKINK